MQPEQARVMWLGAAAAPYFTLAAIDAWMHEKARRVPRAEQALHAGIAVSLTVFFLCAFSGRQLFAGAALLAFAALYSFDEFGFHGGIAQTERRVHAAAMFALLFFVLAWQGLRP